MIDEDLAWIGITNTRANIWLIAIPRNNNIDVVIIAILAHLLWSFIDPYDLVEFLVVMLSENGNIVIDYLRENILTSIIMGVISIAISLRYRNKLEELVVRKAYLRSD